MSALWIARILPWVWLSVLPYNWRLRYVSWLPDPLLSWRERGPFFTVSRALHKESYSSPVQVPRVEREGLEAPLQSRVHAAHQTCSVL